MRKDKAMDKAALQELVSGITDIIKGDIIKVILYGSVARGTSEADSDVDVMLILKREMDNFTEDKLSDFIVDMNLKYNKVFSVIDVKTEEFEKWGNTLPFYKNVNKEGIVLWTVV